MGNLYLHGPMHRVARRELHPLVPDVWFPYALQTILFSLVVSVIVAAYKLPAVLEAAG